MMDGEPACRCRTQALKVPVNQHAADKQSLNQKPSTGPTIRERGKKPLHKISHLKATRLRARIETFKNVNGISDFWGMSAVL